MSSLLNKVLFFPSLFYTMFMDEVTDRNWYDRIDNCVILGALPFRSTLGEVYGKENIRGVLSMNENFELNSIWYPTQVEFENLGIAFKQLPVTDYVGHPTWNQAVQGLDFIDDVCNKNGTVYLHCKAGQYRSALMAATYLMHKYNATPESAEATLRSFRKQVWLRKTEANVLHRFANLMCNKMDYVSG